MLSSERFVSGRVHSSFVTGAGGPGHALFPASQYAKSLEFTQRVFGMAISDYVRLKLSADMSAEIAFLHINPRHHSIAFAQIPGAKRMRHFMFEVADVTDVGRERDRCQTMGQPVAMDIGQHSNDGMVSPIGERKVSQPLPMDVEINAEVRRKSISGEVKGPLGAAPFTLRCVAADGPSR